MARYLTRAERVRRSKVSNMEPYILRGVVVTDIVLGRGLYSSVIEVEYCGLKCAGKKIHDQGKSQIIQRFEEECQLLSQLRHPNVVQFLGVYFPPGERVPILVMERLQTNLTSTIKLVGILPKEIGYSILHDVSLGLCYLHSQTPPIVHQNLSSNNVLLRSDMTAKISDLGISKILGPAQTSSTMRTHGTPAYMPPEMMKANPTYDVSIDKFSYGILIIHIFSGKWPEPLNPVDVAPDGQLIPLSEAERRNEYLQIVGDDHPLMDLIRKCIDNRPKSRPHASEILERLEQMVSAFPCVNRLDLVSSNACIKSYVTVSTCHCRILLSCIGKYMYYYHRIPHMAPLMHKPPLHF